MSSKIKILFFLTLFTVFQYFKALPHLKKHYFSLASKAAYCLCFLLKVLFKLGCKTAGYTNNKKIDSFILIAERCIIKKYCVEKHPCFFR